MRISRGLFPAIVVAGGFVLVGVPLLMVMVLMGGTADLLERCEPDPGSVVLAARGSGGQLNQAQLANASSIVSEGMRLAVPRRALVVALAVAHQESGFRVYANDGLGRDLRSDQVGIHRSLRLVHEAVGSDHGSLGVFQQQWPWWGSMRELMDPEVSARKFYLRLVQVRGWESMSVTEAGQAVQRSAFPDAYADDVPLAEDLMKGLRWPGAAQGFQVALGNPRPAMCTHGGGLIGTVTFPLPPDSGYTDRRNWGATGGAWSRGHTGTDLSVGCGTPVLAATSGTVIVRTDQVWSGRWLVQVSTGVGQLTTWYAHMQSLHVIDGQAVQAGEALGAVGSEGNSTGCHLHFEVHPRGGSIYQDSVNPTSWLRHAVGGSLEGQPQQASRSGTGFMIASFNVLGHSHTARGGDRQGWAPSRARMRLTVELLDRYEPDAIGFQEFQRTQARAFEALAGGEYAVYHPPGETPENSIAWRRSRFELVAVDAARIPYFEGRIRLMPVIRLRDRVTKLDSIFVNVHNPASTRDHPRQAAHRADALRREVALIRMLRNRYEIPVFLTGDLNDRRRAFCQLTKESLMVAAGGGTNDGECRPPTEAGIDWIFGTGGTWFANYERIRDYTVRAASDHPLVLARVVTPEN
jgi:murein DD-endopeptidase MepM/ murein hydrolase activator NlpD